MTGDPAAIDAVGALAASASWADLPDDARRATRWFLLDALGNGLVGATTPDAVALRWATGNWGRGTDAGVWGTNERRPAGLAAYLNCHHVHCLEYDAIVEAAVVHPLTVVVPVVLAQAERMAADGTPVSGGTLAAAVAVGVEVAAGLGVATRSGLRFFRPATAGGLGAVAALGTLTGADAPAVATALGLVYGHLSGTMQPHHEGGAQALALQIAANARGALDAWDLAAAGFAGPRRVLEGEFGYFGLFETDGDVAAFVDGLGAGNWRIAETSMKPYPSGRASHTILDAIDELVRTRGLTAADVAEVRAEVPPMVARLVGRRPVPAMSPGAARLCAPYLVASLLLDGVVDVATCESPRLEEPARFDLARRVEVTASDHADPNAFQPQTVTVRCHDGRVHTVARDAAPGTPGRLTLDQVVDKFGANAAAAGYDERRARAVVDLIGAIDSVEDISPLFAMLGAP